MKRLAYLDSLRGFAILLVVIGHIVQVNYVDWSNNVIFNVICSFHMPLFFFISGCTQAIVKEKHQINNIGNAVSSICSKALKLMIPFLSWSYLVPLFFVDWSQGYNYGNSLWFLPTLFKVFCIYYFIEFIHKRNSETKALLVWILVIVGCLLMICLGIGRFFFVYLLLFIFGYLVEYNKNLLISYKIIPLISVLVFLLTVGRFKYGGAGGDDNRVWLELILSLLASISLFFAFYNNSFNIKVANLLAYLGTYSLSIYVCHLYMLRIPGCSVIENNFPVVLQIAVLTLLAFAISALCILIHLMVRSIPLFSAFMYGEVGVNNLIIKIKNRKNI